MAPTPGRAPPLGIGCVESVGCDGQPAEAAPSPSEHDDGALAVEIGGGRHGEKSDLMT